MYMRWIAGEADYSKLKLSGPFRVGYKDFKSAVFDNDCCVYYPAKNDGSGKQNVFFYSHGLQNLKGCEKAFLFFTRNEKIAGYFAMIMKPFMNVKLPVYRDATVGLLYMQPVIVSHELTGNKTNHSAICMELASCGFCVFSLTHKDGSADYSPNLGHFDGNQEMFDFW